MSDTAPDLGAEIIDPETGEVRPAFPIVVEEVAKGTTGTVKRARRADPLDAIDGCTRAMKEAAAVYRQAYEHVQAGMGMGPMPWARDVPPTRRGGPVMFAQERAITSALWLRRGMQAMGQEDTQGIVFWVVIRGRTLGEWDRRTKRRRHTGRKRLLEALERMAAAYGL